MKEIRGIISGDWHLDSDPKHQVKAQKSLDQMVEYSQNIQLDFLLNPGDIWEKVQNFKRDTGVKIGQEYLRELSKWIDWIIIDKGNNNHDAPGSVELLHKLEPNIIAYEYPVVLAMGTGDQPRKFNESNLVGYVDLLREEMPQNTNPEFIINLLPYPTKENIITNGSIDQNNATFEMLFDGLLEAMGLINDRFKVPKIMGFHGNVRGGRFSSGQPIIGQELIISPHSLLKAKCDFYGLAHIHAMQWIIKLIMGYSGSLYNKNHGEEELKYFLDLSFDEEGMHVEAIQLKAARPMITVEAEFIDGKFIYTNPNLENPEVKFRYKIKDTDKSVLTEDKKEEIKKIFGEDVQLVPNIIPTQRESRSEKIMESENLTDEVGAYAEVVKQDLTTSIKNKIKKIEVGEVEQEEIEEEVL